MTNLERYSFLVITVCWSFHANPVVGQAEDGYGLITANLKVGSSIEVVVSEVTEWGFWLEDETGLLFRQLMSIESRNDSLVRIIKQFVPDVRESVSDIGSESRTTLYFDQIDFPKRIPKPRNALRSREMFLGLHAGSTAELETMISVSVPKVDGLSAQIGFSIGWSIVDKGSFLGGFQAGLGYSIPAGSNTLVVNVAAWKKFYNNEDDRGDPFEAERSAKIVDAYSGTIFYKMPFRGGQNYLMIGPRYYPVNEEYLGKTYRYGLSILVGSDF